MNLKIEINGDSYIENNEKEISSISIEHEKFFESLFKLADKYHLLTESELQTINKIANEKSIRTEI